MPLNRFRWVILILSIHKPNVVDSSWVFGIFLTILFEVFDSEIDILLIFGQYEFSIHAVRRDCECLLCPVNRFYWLYSLVFVNVGDIFVGLQELRPQVDHFQVELNSPIEIS
jgi:hypothetical protein